MKKTQPTIIVLILLFLVPISSLVAQDLSELSKEALIHRLLDAQKMEESIRAGMDASTTSNLLGSMAILLEEQLEKVMEISRELADEFMSSEILRNELYTPIYDSLYSREELVDLIPLLESDVYQDMVNRNLGAVGVIAEETAKLAAPMMPAMMQRVTELMATEKELEEINNPKKN